MNNSKALDVGADMTTQAIIHQGELGILQKELGHSHIEIQDYLRWGCNVWENLKKFIRSYIMKDNFTPQKKGNLKEQKEYCTLHTEGRS